MQLRAAQPARRTGSLVELDQDRRAVAVLDPLAPAHLCLDGEQVRRGARVGERRRAQVLEPRVARTRSEPNARWASAWRTRSSSASSAGSVTKCQPPLPGYSQTSPVSSYTGMSAARVTGVPPSADDDVVDRGDHRLAGVDPGRAKDRHQRLAERLERFRRVPDVEDLKAVLSLERRVVGASGGSALPRVLELLDDVVVLLRALSLHG